jgi:hypothetical protein
VERKAYIKALIDKYVSHFLATILQSSVSLRGPRFAVARLTWPAGLRVTAFAQSRHSSLFAVGTVASKDSPTR